jgi:hypothetical protein
VSYGAGLVGVLLLGFLAGFLAFKVKIRWCGVCGSSLRCIECTSRSRAR